MQPLAAGWRKTGFPGPARVRTPTRPPWRFDDALGQSQGQTGTGIFFVLTIVELLELVEQLVEIFAANTDAGVFDLDAELIRRLWPRAHDDATLRLGEFDGVGKIVIKHLPKASRIGEDLGEGSVEIELQVEIIFGGQRLQASAHVLDHCRQSHRLGLELHLSRLDLRQIENVVDELE